jgi:hypothetical protein
MRDPDLEHLDVGPGFELALDTVEQSLKMARLRGYGHNPDSRALPLVLVVHLRDPDRRERPTQVGSHHSEPMPLFLEGTDGGNSKLGPESSSVHCHMGLLNARDLADQV